uniref:Uncharacterized protein n=1 Tax=Vespula pensylvanica TaxID=30213 RepID=A0A834NQP4_VESPE|nr:hypothetical protein H0235_012288 [Vespula pensylvanica]
MAAKGSYTYFEGIGTKSIGDKGEEYPMPMKIMQFSTSQRKPNSRGNRVTMSSTSLENLCVSVCCNVEKIYDLFAVESNELKAENGASRVL